MAWQDFMRAIRASNEEETRRAREGGFKNRALNFVDEAIDRAAPAVRETARRVPSSVLPTPARGFVDAARAGVFETPQAAAVGNFAQDVAQSIPRGVANLAVSVKEAAEDSAEEGQKDRIREILEMPEDERKRLADAGDNDDNTDSRAIFLSMARKKLGGDLSDKALNDRIAKIQADDADDDTIVNKNPVARFLFGSEEDEKIETVQQKNKNIEKDLLNKGASPGVASGLAVAGAGGLAALDSPVGGAGKAAKAVIKSGKKVLKPGMELVDDVAGKVDDVADDLASIAQRDPNGRPAGELQTALERAQGDPAARAAAEADLADIDPALAGRMRPESRDAGKIFMDAQREGSPITMDEARKQAAGGIQATPPTPAVTPPKNRTNTAGFGDEADELLGNIKFSSEVATKPRSQWKQQAKEQLYDKLSPMNDLVKEIQTRTGRKLATEDNPYELMRLYQGMPDRVKVRLDGLTESLKQAPNIDAVKVIGMGRQIIDREGRGIDSTVTGDAARKAIEGVRAKLGDEDFDKAAAVVDTVTDYNRKLLDELHDEGIISDGAYKAINDVGANYFSKFNVIDHIMKDDNNRAFFASGSYNVTKASLNKILKEAVGHKEGTELLDPIESIVRSTDATMRAVARNQIYRSFDRLADDAPELVQRIRDPDDVLGRISLALDNKELRPIRDKTERLMKTRGQWVRRLESEVNRLEKEGMQLSLRNGGERMTNQNFSVAGLGGDVATGQTGKNVKKQDFTVDAAGNVTRGSDAERITAAGQRRDANLRKADEAMPENVPGSTALRPAADFAQALAYRDQAKTAQKTIDGMTKAGRSGATGETTGSKLGKGDTQSFLRNLIENGSRRDIDRIKAKIGTRDANMTKILDEIGEMKSQYDDVAGRIKANRDEIRARADKEIPEGMRVISGFGKGVQAKIAIPEEVAEVYMGKTKAQQDYVTSMMSTVNGFVKRNFTSNNPTFALVTNPIRDSKSFAYNVKDLSANPLSIGKALVQGFASSLKKDEYYKRYVEAGGKSGFYADDRMGEDLAKDVARQTSGKSILGVKVRNVTNAKEFVEELRQIAGAPLRVLPRVAGVLEDAPRVAQFRASLAAGKSDAQAAINSRNVTVDFQQSGRVGQVMNAWIPFLNARAQGTIKSAEAIKRNPARAAAVYASLTAAPILMAAANNARFPDVMDMIPDDVRDTNFVFVYGDDKDESGNFSQVIKIPKSDVDRILGNPLEQFARYMADDDPDSIGAILTNFVGSVLPVDTVKDDAFNTSRAIGGVLPPLIKAPLEAATNRSLYFDSDIVPSNMQDLPDDEQIRTDNPATPEKERETSKAAQFMTSIVGGSPIKNENTLRNFTGNLLVQNPKDTLAGKLGGASDSKMQNEFYKNIEKTEKLKASTSKQINEAIAAGDLPTARSLAVAYNEQLREQFAPFEDRYGDRMTDDMVEIYYDQKINLSRRSVKQRQRANLERAGVR